MRPGLLSYLRSAAGFTLVELLVVAVIAVAMVAVAAPLFGGGLQRAGLRQDAVELASTLRYARNRAVTSGRPTSVRLDLDERSYAVAGEPRSETRLDDDYAIRVTYAELAGQDDEQAELRFFPDGSSTGGEVLITLRGSGWAVQVEWLTGRVSILEARGVGDA
jgi:general secretion pathway protein H